MPLANRSISYLFFTFGRQSETDSRRRGGIRKLCRIELESCCSFCRDSAESSPTQISWCKLNISSYYSLTPGLLLVCPTWYLNKGIFSHSYLISYLIIQHRYRYLLKINKNVYLRNNFMVLSYTTVLKMEATILQFIIQDLWMQYMHIVQYTVPLAMFKTPCFRNDEIHCVTGVLGPNGPVVIFPTVP